jgi:tetratricopeptide (TPR) repeat protein
VAGGRGAAQPASRPQPDRRYVAAVKTFEDAVRLLQKQSFARARELFRKLAEVPFLEISGRAQIHARLCERRLSLQGRAPRGAEEYYDLGIAALNARQLDRAIAQLSKSDRLQPNRDHVQYALAAAHAVSHNPEVALAHLKAAIAMSAGNRGRARHDDDFLLLENDPRFRKLVGTEVPALSSSS